MAFRIGELAKATGVSEHTLRFYEKEGLVVPQRDQNNVRVYTEENRQWIEFIMHMKATGMSIETLKRYTECWALGDEGLKDVIEMLMEHRIGVLEKLETYQKNLDLLDTKIQFYQDNLEKSEKEDLYEKFIQEKL